MNNPPLMACGHAANGKKQLSDGTQVDCCVICGEERMVEKPDLTGRRSRCFYKHDHTKRKGNYPAECESAWNLPFFEYKPNGPTDEHYCGCYGWD